LLGAAVGAAGFRYQPDLIDAAKEHILAARLAELAFETFDFRGHLAHRPVVGCGLRYDYASRPVRAAPRLPDWLLSMREAVRTFAGWPGEVFVQVLIKHHRADAGIGCAGTSPNSMTWSVSRFCRPGYFGPSKVWSDLRAKLVVIEPRAAYLLSGAARHVWEHSIPPLETQRCSITAYSGRAG
jgi:alkylated DNA repair dioxygenase AlkB